MHGFQGVALEPSSLTLSEAFRCGNSRVKAFAYSRYVQVLILGGVGSLQ